MSFFDQTTINEFINLLGRQAFIYNYGTLLSNKKTTRLASAIKQCCGNNIGIDYINERNRDIRNQPDEFEIVVVTSEALTPKNILPDIILGFMIVQKGECKRFSDLYCVNLICARSDRGKGTGAILIALYLYCIYNNSAIADKIGLLELANSYINVGGLCLYSKFGFEYDSSLHGDDCFSDHNNLPMLVDIKQKYKSADNADFNQKLIQIALAASDLFVKPPICNMRGQKQLIMGIAKNLEKFIFENKTSYIIEDYILADGTTYNYVAFNQLVNNDINTLYNFIDKIPTLDDAELTTIINKIIIPPGPPRSATPPPVITRKTRSTKIINGGKRHSKKHKKH